MKQPTDTIKMTEKLLNDELISTKLFDNYNFQYVFTKEIQRQVKSETQDCQINPE
ncbi:hypothetical protein [Polynucleobacter kasalickyi]|uniref:Uncharacterized protein n=1 Tax=Polynucleobacter kasalickyi TaxID=1938817 RepID=A0A1W1Z8U1_9BURK|nr:hypothetical protein [Polynucleobacter kasalickyi]SMC44601.1 hypothetical protein SAMN06296008_104186 [Polynucleobacter kasalickyi]